MLNLEVRSSKILPFFNLRSSQRSGLIVLPYTTVFPPARGDARERRTGSHRNMWCFSVVFRIATCEHEIAQTAR